MPQQSNSTFSFRFNGILWKILLDESDSRLLVEIRNNEDHKADFAGIDLNAKKILWQGLKLEESWWLGMEQISEGKLILHEFEDAQKPEHKGVMVADSKSGKLLWENKERTFFSVLKGQMLVYDPSKEERVYEQLDLNTGKNTGEFSQEKLLKNLDLMMNARSGSGNELKNAFHFNTENPYFSKVADYVKETQKEIPVLALDYLESGTDTIISYYIAQGKELENILLLMDEDGNVKLKESLGSALKGIGMDTFFVYKNMLVYIVNKNELKIYTL